MSDILTPRKVYNDFLKGKINKKSAIDLLISLLERSEQGNIRAKCLEIIGKIEINSENMYKILENTLLSDENSLVRSLAAKEIVQKFPAKGINVIKWAIIHDKSPLVLNNILKVIRDSQARKYLLFKNEIEIWVNNFANRIGIVPEEADFFLNLEAIFAGGYIDYEINATTFKYYKSLRNFNHNGSWLDIKDKHVISLTFNYFNWKYLKERLDSIDSIYRMSYPELFLSTLRNINVSKVDFFQIPASIGTLIYLKKLDLSQNKIRKLPDSLSNLKYLEFLNLNNNNIQKFPSSVFSLKSLKELDLSYNNIKIIPQTIQSLSSLKKLDLSHNSIRKISPSVYTFMKSLDYFKL